MTSYGPPNQPGPPSGPPPGGYGPPSGPGSPGPGGYSASSYSGSSAAGGYGSAPGGSAKPGIGAVNPYDWAILGAGLLALIFSFFSFYSYEAKGELKTACGQNSDALGIVKQLCGGDSASAWHGFFGWFGVVLIVLGALAVVMAVFGPQVSLPVSVRLVGTGLAALGTIFVLLALFLVPDWPPVSDLITNEDQYNKTVDNGAGFSLYVVLALGLIVTALSFLRFQQTGGALPGRSGAAPVGGFGGGPGSSGAGYPTPGGQPAEGRPPQYPPQPPPPQGPPPQGPSPQGPPPQGPSPQGPPPQGPPPHQAPPQGPPAGYGEQAPPPGYGQQPPQGYQTPPGYQPPPQ